MDISSPLNLLPINRPPPAFVQFKAPNPRQTPRRFNNDMPRDASSDPRPRILAPPQPYSANESRDNDTNTNPWKMTRVFDDILESYQQIQHQPRVEPDLQPRANHSYARQTTPRQPQHPYQIPQSPTSEMDSAENPRQTVPIGYDPSYGLRQAGPYEPRESRFEGAQQNNLDDLKAQYIEQTAEVRPPQFGAAGMPGDYSPDWIVEEPRDITDTEYYDSDPDHASYTYGSSQFETASTAKDSGSVHATEDTEFEKPREATHDHRQTMFVVKEDIDFYMAIVGGMDPPPATAETQSVVSQEQESRRRSLETEEQEAAWRRQEESETTKGDLDFWMSLMKKA